jgi:hypothetical protein
MRLTSTAITAQGAPFLELPKREGKDYLATVNLGRVAAIERECHEDVCPGKNTRA